MRKKIIVIVTGMVLLVSAWVGTASAQDIPGYPPPGYPVETETPPPTEVPTTPPEETPTPDPTDPPQPDPTEDPQPDPTEVPPTWEPTQPPPTPSETPEYEFPACPFPRQHPVLVIISDTYGIPFEDVADMFCNSHMGIGEIVRYLESLQRPEINNGLGSLPEQDGHGWGLFRWVLNLIGRPGNRAWTSPS